MAGGLPRWLVVDLPFSLSWSVDLGTAYSLLAARTLIPERHASSAFSMFSMFRLGHLMCAFRFRALSGALSEENAAGKIARKIGGKSIEEKHSSKKSCQCAWCVRVDSGLSVSWTIVASCALVLWSFRQLWVARPFRFAAIAVPASEGLGSTQLVLGIATGCAVRKINLFSFC